MTADPEPDRPPTTSAHERSELGALDRAQVDGSGDMDVEAFRAAAHEVVDVMADYLAGVADRPVFPAIEPGTLRPRFPIAPPEQPEPLEAILADYGALVEPNATHWQHPGFLAYFSTTASGPGILGEMLTAALGQNPMLWRTSPIGTELEGVVVDWLRQALGLPEPFDGLLTDTASSSSLIALAAAREAAGLDAAALGLADRPGTGAPTVYASAEAHMSIEKACMTLGLGRSGLRRIPTNDRYELRTDALEAAIAEDRAAGLRPIAIVATIGTTSCTSVDPVAPMADVAAREGLWLHVDAAYAGPVALIPGRRGPFSGWDRADSIVVNPHKWLFAPLDASLLLTRRMDELRAAFSLVPDYLGRSTARLQCATTTSTSHSWGAGCGRSSCGSCFATSGWPGCGGGSSVISSLPRGSRAGSTRIPDWQRLAPVPFSTICFRWRRADLVGQEADPAVASWLDERNAAVIEAVNRTGEVFLSHTRLGGQFTIRVAIGNLRTEERHVERAWDLLRRAAAGLDARG